MFSSSSQQIKSLPLEREKKIDKKKKTLQPIPDQIALVRFLRDGGGWETKQ